MVAAKGGRRESDHSTRATCDRLAAFRRHWPPSADVFRSGWFTGFFHSYALGKVIVSWLARLPFFDATARQ